MCEIQNLYDFLGEEIYDFVILKTQFYSLVISKTQKLNFLWFLRRQNLVILKRDKIEIFSDFLWHEHLLFLVISKEHEKF